MTVVRMVYKSILMILAISIFVVFSSAWRIRTRNQIQRRKFYVISVSYCCEVILKILNIKVNAINVPEKESSHLIVGNHMGTLDIFILAAHCPTLFITSQDLRKTPGLGFISEMAGCLYVDRRNRANIHGEIQEIRDTLKQKFNISLYPEGQATNGEKVLPFKKSLITAAVGTGVSIRPVVVNYRKVNGEPMSTKWRDHVSWYGDHSFISAILRTFSAKSIDADLEFCQEVHIQSEQDRRQIADQLHQIVSSKFTPII